MSFFADKSARTRQNALALILLAVLLLATGVAWWLSHHAAPPPPDEKWYLISDAEGQPIGWSAQRRQTTPQGSSGYQVQSIRNGAPFWSKWALNANATGGRYLSMAPREGSQGQMLLGVIAIDYAGSKVAIRQTVVTPEGQRLFSKSLTQQVGEDYVAEGTLEPKLLQAAKDGEPFSGTMVVDEYARLMPVMLTPLEAASQTSDKERGQATVVEEQLGTQEHPLDGVTRYYVAADGTIPLIERVEDGRVVIRQALAGYEQVRQHFPDALSDRIRALKDHKLESDD